MNAKEALHRISTPPMGAASSLVSLIAELRKYGSPHAQLSDPNEALPEELPNILQHLTELVKETRDTQTGDQLQLDTVQRNAEVVRAATYLLEHLLHMPAATHYRVLGLAKGASDRQIRDHYLWLRSIYWFDQTSTTSHNCVNRLNEAYVVLRDPKLRRRYDKDLSKLLGETNKGLTPPKEPREQREWSQDSKVKSLTYQPLDGNLVRLETDHTERVAINATESDKKNTKHNRVRLALATMIAVASVAGLVRIVAESRDGLFDELTREATNLGSVQNESLARSPLFETSESGRESASQALQVTENVSAVRPESNAVDGSGAVAETHQFTNDERAARAFPQESPGSPSRTSAIADSSTIASANGDKRVKTKIAEPSSSNGSLTLSVAQLLVQAQQHLDNWRLTLPAGENAFETYQAILAKEPTNADALLGLRVIADHYEEKARFRLKEGRYNDALAATKRGLSVDAEHPVLRTLLSQIETDIQNVDSRSVSERMVDPNSGADTTLRPTERDTDQTPSSSENAIDNAIASIPQELVSDPASVVEASTQEPAQAQDNPQTINGISEEDLNIVLSRFSQSYEAGDLTEFLSIFAGTARTNNRQNLLEIKQDYETLFTSTSVRLMHLHQVKWRSVDDMAIGQTAFDLTLLKSNEAQPRNYTGVLTFNIERIDGELLVTGLFHTQERIGGSLSMQN